jgi:subtilisin family serine protease
VSRFSVALQATCIALFLSAACPSATAAVSADHRLPLYVPGQVLVKYKTLDRAARVLAKLGVTTAQEQRYVAGDSRLSLIQLPRYSDVLATVRALRSSGLVEYAEPNYYRYPLTNCSASIVTNHPEDSGKACVTPNDPDIPYAWYVNNPGNSAGTAVAGADINLLAAWGINPDSTDVKVAVIDDGFDLANPDLVFDSPGVNCAGSSACSGTAAATKTDGTEDHGTWVSGTLAATGNNYLGTAGATWHTDLLPIKSDLTVASIANAIHQAVDSGAKIINESFGGPTPSNTEYNALKYALQNNVLVVVAAGNNDSDNDRAGGAYPANYAGDSVLFPNEDSSGNPIPGATSTKPGLPNVIAVGATDANDQLTSWSQWGSFNVDLLAPGENISATQRGDDGKTSSVSGTSFSTPLTSGVAALAAEKDYGSTTASLFDYHTVKAQLLDGTDPGAYNTSKPATQGALRGRSATGRLNAYKAVQSSTKVVMLVRGVTIDDNTGLNAGNDADGEIDPNETINLVVTVANAADNPDTAISGKLIYLGTDTNRTNTSYASVTNTPTTTTLTAPSGSTLVDPEGTLSFPVQIGAIPDNESLLFELDLTATPSGVTQKRYFYVEAGSLTNNSTLVSSLGRNSYDDFQDFHITVPAGASNLIISTRTDNGTDIDLLVQKDGLPQYLETLGPNPDSNPEFQQYIDPNTQISGNMDGNETVAYDGLANPYNFNGAANPATSAGTYHIVAVNFTAGSKVNYSINACYAPAGSDQISFAGNVEVAEDGKTATLKLLRSGSSGAVSVNYATSNGGAAPLVSSDPSAPAAIAGTNYTRSSGSISWADGDSKPKTISIPIINTASIVDKSVDFKHFTVSLSGLTGGAGTTLGCLRKADVALMAAAKSSGGGTTTPPPASGGKSGGGAIGLLGLGMLLLGGFSRKRRP